MDKILQNRYTELSYYSIKNNIKRKITINKKYILHSFSEKPFWITAFITNSRLLHNEYKFPEDILVYIPVSPYFLYITNKFYFHESPLFGNYAFIGYSNQSQAIEFFKNFKFLFKNIQHKITPLKKEEIENIQNTINTYAPNVKLPFKNNSYTKISLAPFSGFIARITNMSNNSLTIQFKIKDIKIVGKIFHPFILECVK